MMRQSSCNTPLFLICSVDIGTAPRSRKLRAHASETVVSGATYAQRLRAQFEKLHGKPAWASKTIGPFIYFFSAHQIDDEVDGSDDEEDSLTKHAGPVLKKKGGRLLATTLDIARVRDLTHRGECKVSTLVSFSYIRL